MLGIVWPDIWPLLEPAVRRSKDEAARHVLALLRAGTAQLWAVMENGRPIAAVVTRVRPGERCLLWLIGGSRAREWADDLLVKVEQWARSLGCTALWGVGRRGWARIVEPRGFVRIEDFEGQPAWQRRIA
jgi:hypothetical protein